MSYFKPPLFRAITTTFSMSASPEILKMLLGRVKAWTSSTFSHPSQGVEISRRFTSIKTTYETS